MSFFELRTPRDLLEKAHREHDRLTCAFNIDNVFNFFVTAFHIVHREPDRRTGRAAGALQGGRMEHPAQVLPDYASKAFYKARDLARDRTRLFDGMSVRQMPTLHEIRALSSHLYATAGYEVAAVQELMAHTDPDMTRAYQKGHARKVLRVEMMLPYRVPQSQPDNAVRERRPVYRVAASPQGQEIFPENSLNESWFAA